MAAKRTATEGKSLANPICSASDAVDGMSAKIRDHHREGLAFVYVLHSSQRQVQERRASAALQYVLNRRAEKWTFRQVKIAA